MRNKTLTYIGIGLTAVGLYAYSKYKSAKAIMKKLTIKPKKINDLKLSWQYISFRLTIEIFNNTPYDLGYTPISIIYLDSIEIYTPNQTLVATLLMDKIQLLLPANTSVLLSDIPVEIHTMNILDQANNLLSYVQQDSLLIHLVVNAFGKKYTIKT